MGNPGRKGDEWRKFFVETWRGLILKEPGFWSVIEYGKSGSFHGFEMATFRSGDKFFIDNLKKIASNIEEKTGMAYYIPIIEAGYPTYQDDFVSEQVFNHEAYDTKETYKQWKSQELWGHQTIIQMEVPAKGKDLSKQIVFEMLEKAVSLVEGELLSTPKDLPNVGDGCALAATWSDGTNIVVLWDGRKHVGINLFTLEEDTELPTEIAENFRSLNPTLKVALRDDTPRGYGRVVNFWSDFGEDRIQPYWAAHVA